MKKLWIAFLACISFVCIAFGVACKGGDKQVLAFNEGYLEEIVLGDPIMLDEYIDPYLTDDYTAILTCDETGQERNLKELVQWTTDRPGTYTLTYTVNSGEYKGTISTKINVVVSKATWKYSNSTLVFREGETMNFNLFKRNLNIAVNSYYDYEFYVKEVSHNGTAEDLSDKTSYTFPDHGDFIFTFCVETEDGQVLSAKQKLTVRKAQELAVGAVEWMEENNISVDPNGYTYISPDGYVELDEGYINGSYYKDYVPYIAFNGEEGGTGYGADTYVTVDFTGKNLPQVAFFCDEVTPSFTDGGKGILLFNGFAYGRTNVEPQISRMVAFGPNKASYGEFDNQGRLVAIGSTASPCPASWNSLVPSCKYRYIIGIENAKSTSMTVRILLINLTNSERVWDLTQTLSTYTVSRCSQNPCPHPNGGCSERLNLDSSYYTGSIVLYGTYGHDVTFDKVYMPVTGVSDIYELDQAAEFKEEYKKNCNLGDTANVADYIVLPESDYEFRVVDPDGNPVPIDENGNFTYTKSGSYRLYYAPSDVNIRPSSITVKVMYDLTVAFAADYLETQGVINSYEGGLLAVPNTNTNFITEGSQSIKYYAANAKDAIDVFVSKEFTDFVYLTRKAQGVCFEIYSAKALTFKLKALTDDPANTAYLREDYTGTIPAETWTTITLSRALMMTNFETYKNALYSIALTLETAGGFSALDCVYIDNIQLILDSEGTIASEAQSFMTKNNITAYAYDSITADRGVALKASYYQGRPEYGTQLMSDDDVSYVAYNGNYGAGDYVVVDFTGKNVPQFCFFAKEVTSSLLDGKAGFYIHTGISKQNGDYNDRTDGGRVTFFGPNKIEYAHVNNLGRFGIVHGSADEPSPLSIRGLKDGVHYRYVVGIKSAQSGKFVLEQLLINLDTNTEEARYETTVTGKWITSDYITGNIVMYGRYNVAITLDKIYAVYENVDNINAIDKVSEVFGA